MTDRTKRDADAMAVRPAVKVDGRRQKGDRRKRAILESAREVFLENGYRGATLDAIIAKAGGSRQTIYQTFGGKSGLFSAIVQQVGDDLIAATPAMRTHDTPVRDVLIDFGTRLFAIWRSPEGSAINHMVVSEGLDAPELMSAWFESGPRPSLRHLAAFLAQEDAAGILHVQDADLIARQFMFLLMGALAFPAMSRQPPPDAAADIAAAVDMVLARCKRPTSPAERPAVPLAGTTDGGL